MKNSEIKELTTKELQERLEGVVAELHNLKLQHSISPLPNPMVIREKRRDIARIKTELGNRD
ncbi:MAG: 50S ribosomal protein L29 [Paludibacteraceae bacterium]|jgi:large subunit ribosomal protein L29|nr:50S ribosomal protein L29 [Paludibacteraceae bacterium]